MYTHVNSVNELDTVLNPYIKLLRIETKKCLLLVLRYCSYGLT